MFKVPDFHERFNPERKIAKTNFIVRANLKGFDKYVTKRNLVQNRDAYISQDDDHTNILTRDPVGAWLAAPQASPDGWLIRGREGDDFIQGSDVGSNYLLGDLGNDIIHGGLDTKNLIIGGDGDDKIWGYNGEDTIRGERGNDVIYAGKNDDRLDGGMGDDRLYGYQGDDTLFGRQGDDLLLAGVGSNVYEGGSGADRFGLMKKHKNIINDFDPSHGDQLLIRRKHIDSVEISVLPDHSEGASFELKSKIGTCIIYAMLEASTEDIFNSIKVM
jgi:Ca2+-binding RTX toxin-like protein